MTSAKIGDKYNKAESLELIHLVAQMANIGIWDWYIQDDKLVWNDEMFIVFGIDGSQFQASYEAFINCVHPQDIDRVNAAVAETLEKRIPYDINYRINTASGELRHVHAIGHFFEGSKTRSDRLTGICFDITEQQQYQATLEEILEQEKKRANIERRQRLRSETLFKENETLYKTILNHVTDGWWDWNLETNDEYLSPSFKALFGYQDSELANRAESWQKIIYQEDKAIAVEAFEQHTKYGKPFNIPVRYHHKDGSTVWVLCRGQAIKDQDGVYRRMVGTHTNITKMKEYEAQLKAQHDILDEKVKERTKTLQQTNEQLIVEMEKREQLQAQLLQSQKLEALGQLAGGVAHDFNNLLTGMFGFTNLIKKSAEKELTLKQVGLLEGAIQRAAAITSQLLTFSRQSTFKKENVNMLELVNEVKGLLAHSLNKNMKIEIESENELPHAFADSTAISQTFLNIGLNAIQAMEMGGLLKIRLSKLQVTFVSQSQYPELKVGCYLHCQFSDTGPGIAKAHISKIFDPFFTTKETGKGTGLGLSLAYSTIVEHGGSLMVRSIEGQGAVFDIYLPAASSSS